MQQPPYQQPGQYPGSQPYQQPGQYPGSQPQGYQQPYQQPQGYPQPYQQPGVNPAYAGQQKDWLTTLLLCIFVGYLGVHSFYTGKTVFGILQLVTLGGCGIWTLVDLIMIITDKYVDGNGLPLLKKQ
ncbi:MAG TPA: TM2 domain-containing protein [Ktedonobacterales bacterium]|nr:TM2 domain-containing protein [Ktedonobacterales bacterium]